MKPAIRIANVSKRYRLGELHRHWTLGDKLASLFKRRGAPNGGRTKPGGPRDDKGADEIWAVKDVSFDVAPGEVVGIIGRNGAGKSTLLKILSRITEPTQGEVELFGRVSSLLEVGTGFHPELTGRDNVYLNGSILGMKKAEIDQKFEEIVAFSGVEKFLDTPVKHYSSGMQVRLAFAVAAHLEPEILIVDEVLAVGDAEFQRKCIGKMSEVAGSGRTIFFVSHNMAAVANLCSRGILMQEGAVAYSGTVADCVARYGSSSHASFSLAGTKFIDRAEFLIDDVHVSHLNMGQGSTLSVSFRTPTVTKHPRIGIVLRRQLTGEAVFGIDSDMLGVTHAATSSNAFKAQFIFDRLDLIQGQYYMDLYVGCDGQNHERLASALELNISDSDVFGTGRLPSPQYGPIFVKPILLLTVDAEGGGSKP